MKMLLLPVTLLKPALTPSPMFEAPVVFRPRALAPMAVL